MDLFQIFQMYNRPSTDHVIAIVLVRSLSPVAAGKSTSTLEDRRISLVSGRQRSAELIEH